MKTIEQLEREKLELEIEQLKRKMPMSKRDKEFLMGMSFALGGNILGSDKW